MRLPPLSQNADATRWLTPTWATVRYQHRREPPVEKRIDQVAYVFLDESDARAHLHELWLRELEVWLVDGDGKRRIDLAYQPAPVRLEWIESLHEK